MERIATRLPIDDIKPNPNNPRTITNDQMDKLVKSIDDFPDMMKLRPIVVDENNTILGGNMRWQALKRRGDSEVEVIKAVGLTEDQKREFIVKDNLAFGDWDWDSLAKQYSVDELETYGMDDIQIEEPEPEIIEDEAPEPEDEAISKLGEVYQLGDHLLICGSADSNGTLAKLMGASLADLLETDPPYGVDLWNLTPEEAKKQHHRTDGLTIQNDNMDRDEMADWLDGTFGVIDHYLKPGGSYYIWHASSTISEFYNAISDAIAEPRQQLIWVKNRIVMGRQDYQWRHEPCLYGWKGGASHYFIDDRSRTTVWEKPLEVDKMSTKELRELVKQMLETNDYPQSIVRFDKPAVNKLHPTMKPVELIAYQIKNSTRPGEVVLDPFGGSGTTLIACEQTNRICRMVELDPRYCDVIRKRWWKLTHGGDEDGWEDGTKAVKETK